MPELEVLSTERILSLLKWAFAWTSLALGGSVLLWGIYGEVNLWVKHSYTIAEVVEKRRSNKFEPLVDYTYSVQGSLYRSSQVWNGKAQIGERYVVKYAVYAPYGNKLFYQYPVPDSVQQDTGPQWHQFMQAILLY